MEKIAAFVIIGTISIIISCSSSSNSSEGSTSSEDRKTEEMYEAMHGYVFSLSPASFKESVGEGMLRTFNSAAKASAIASGDSTYLAMVTEDGSIYEQGTHNGFVISNDSIFNLMIDRSSFLKRHQINDSTVSKVDFAKEFVVVLYEMPSSMLGGQAYITMGELKEENKTLYIPHSTMLMPNGEYSQYTGTFWQVAMYKIKRRNFERVALISKDTTYFPLLSQTYN